MPSALSLFKRRAARAKIDEKNFLQPLDSRINLCYNLSQMYPSDVRLAPGTGPHRQKGLAQGALHNPPVSPFYRQGLL